MCDQPVIAASVKAKLVEAGGDLLVAKLDRLSRSMLDFAALMATAQKQHWALVALDCAVDTSTPAGEAMAHVLATFGQFERRLIGQRTKEALAAKKASGVRLGRPPTVPQSVVRRIRRQRVRGDSLRKIADDLNAASVPANCTGRRAMVRGDRPPRPAPHVLGGVLRGRGRRALPPRLFGNAGARFRAAHPRRTPRRPTWCC